MKQTNTEALNKILDTMDIPENRKNDLNWLRRNLGVRNSSHPDFNKAVVLIKIVLLEQ
jgi:hypothetical protein